MIPDKAPPQLRVSAEQMIVALEIDQQAAQLQLAANQLGGGLKQTEAADLLIAARDVLLKGKEELMRKWAGSVVLAKPGDVPRLVQP